MKIEKLPKSHLIALCKINELDASGLKADLIERLKNAGIKTNDQDDQDDDQDDELEVVIVSPQTNTNETETEKKDLFEIIEETNQYDQYDDDQYDDDQDDDDQDDDDQDDELGFFGEHSKDEPIEDDQDDELEFFGEHFKDEPIEDDQEHDVFDGVITEVAKAYPIAIEGVMSIGLNVAGYKPVKLDTPQKNTLKGLFKMLLEANADNVELTPLQGFLVGTGAVIFGAISSSKLEKKNNIEVIDYSKMSKSELVVEAQKLGLDATGKKAEILNRILEN